eukprot:Skav205132  [mRNA]  locus=scaffold3411:59923:79937:- [translate_table: standard]
MDYTFTDSEPSSTTTTPADRMLLHGHMGGNGIEFQMPTHMKIESRKDSWVAFAWVACKSLVDLWLEYCELRGLVHIGEWKSWFQVHNLMRALLAGAWHQGGSWNRRLERVKVELDHKIEYIGEELLPIIDLASGLAKKRADGGLGPSLFVTFIAFGAFTHAFYLVRKSAQEFYLVLIAVLFFSVLIMNVFIGVICELYTSAKENAKLVFKRRRAESDMLYLLRARVIPCHYFSSEVAFGIMMGAGAVALCIQVYCFMDHSFKGWVFWPFLVCQVTIVLMGFQQPDKPWIRKQWDPSMPPHYLWFCKQKDGPVGLLSSCTR